uniref:Uncharacterized protein n=1 Tax=Avena sativa TaxID=4498 RepID=A0ACD5VP36_AVESA
MRIKTGMMVEAWITDDPTTMGAWRAGEVIWGNGHSYIMKWLDGGPDSARISRKFVRPIPDPDVQVPDDLAAGDIVELFDSGLWKWVEVVRVGDRHLDVKFVGSTKVLMADRSILRPRLLYGQDGWVVVHKNDKIPIRSAVPSRPIAGKNIKSKAIGNGGSNFAAHAVKLGKTKRSDYMVHADIVRDVKRFQGNNDTNRVFAKPKREEPAARYNDNTEVMDVHPSHCYLKKRQETGNNLDRLLAPRTESDKDDDVSSKSETSSSSGDSSSTSSSSSSSGSNSKGSDHIVSSGNGAGSGDSADAELQGRGARFGRQDGVPCQRKSARLPGEGERGTGGGETR